MEKSKVYFTNLRTRPGYNLLDKLEKLIKSAGMLSIDFSQKLTAVKIHFGEPGNLAYIRHNYAKKVVELIEKQGGKPFLTDANTLYMGRRSNAVEHLQSAFEHGFHSASVFCPVIIADGLKGTEQREIEVNGKHVKTAKIGSAIADADIIVSMNHFKGHEMTGFGGALKNLGMGSGSKAGKLEMHSASKPVITESKCIRCGMCIKNCAQSAISYGEVTNKAQIDPEKCVGCGQCIAMCRFDACGATWDESTKVVGEKIAEYTLAVLKDKPHFHINFIMNVSPDCDCWGYNDMPIVPDIGILASFDPVAIDMACADLVNIAPSMKGSILEEKNFNQDGCINENCDKFHHIHPSTSWISTIQHAQILKIGNGDYEMIDIDAK